LLNGDCKSDFAFEEEGLGLRMASELHSLSSLHMVPIYFVIRITSRADLGRRCKEIEIMFVFQTRNSKPSG